jgi:cellulose synthase (UDP-forming)
MITLYWATGGLVQPVLTDVSHVLTMPAALRATFVGLLKPRGHRFKVTDKGGHRDHLRVQWGMVARFGILIGLTLAGMLYASLADYTPERQSAGSTAVILFWSVYNVVVLVLAIAACIELPRYRREERFATSERVAISAGDYVFTAPLADISVNGARILAPSPGQPDDIVWLEIESIGEVAARIVAGSNTSFAVEFVDVDRARDALIGKIFSGRYSQHPQRMSGRHTLAALVARAIR